MSDTITLEVSTLAAILGSADGYCSNCVHDLADLMRVVDPSRDWVRLTHDAMEARAAEPLPRPTLSRSQPPAAVLQQPLLKLGSGTGSTPPVRPPPDSDCPAVKAAFACAAHFATGPEYPSDGPVPGTNRVTCGARRGLPPSLPSARSVRLCLG